MLIETKEQERQATIEELSGLLHVAQEMGQRLASETHGDAYEPVRELNETLHRARLQLAAIEKGA